MSWQGASMQHAAAERRALQHVSPTHARREGPRRVGEVPQRRGTEVAQVVLEPPRLAPFRRREPGSLERGVDSAFEACGHRVHRPQVSDVSLERHIAREGHLALDRLVRVSNSVRELRAKIVCGQSPTDPGLIRNDHYGHAFPPRAVSARPRPDPLQTLFARYLEAQLAGDRRAALRVVLEDGLAAGHSVSDLHTGVVQAAQAEIGRMWQDNRISIAQEHMATAISHVVASRLFEEAKPEARIGKRILVACVAGEYHEFPARLVADYLDLGGFDVLYLGANVPTDHLIAMVRDTMPDLVALSVTMSFNVPALRDALRRIRAAFPTLPLLMGGHALAWEPGLADECGGATCDADPDSVVRAAREQLGLGRAQ